MLVFQGSSAGVIIDPINTKAMQTAKQAGQTPFALLKPAKGIPVLVKVMAAPDDKQVFSGRWGLKVCVRERQAV
jgi:hypothetical protein